MLTGRAGVRSNHYNYLYASRENSIEIKNSSPGVSTILHNKSTVKERNDETPIEVNNKLSIKESLLLRLNQRLDNSSKRENEIMRKKTPRDFKLK